MSVTVTLADRQTDRHNEANTGLRNFFRNGLNKMWEKGRDGECRAGLLTYIDVQQDN